MSKSEYLESVISYLETLDYPALVEGYEPLDVAKTMFKIIEFFYMGKQSYILCAVTIWSHTMEYQIRIRTVN